MYFNYWEIRPPQIQTTEWKIPSQNSNSTSPNEITSLTKFMALFFL